MHQQGRFRRRSRHRLGMGDLTHTLDNDFLLYAGSTMAQAAGIGPTLTFTRASTAWGFDENGLLVSAANDAPVFDHDLTGTALGLGNWEQRTGSALWVRDFTDAAWVKSNITAAKDATGLDGSANSASTLTATAGNGTALQTITIASAAFTHAVYVKRKTGTGDIDITDNNGTNWTTLTGLSSTAWTRYNITRTQANPVIGFRIVNDTDAIEVDIAGLENGAFPTPPIVTTNAAVTREPDVCTTADVTWLDANTGTMFAQGSIPVAGAVERSLFTIDDGTATDRLRLYMDAAENVNFETINSADTNGASDGAAVIAVDTTFKVASAYADDDVRAAVDGTLSAADSAAGIPVTDAATAARIGNDSVGTPFNGHIAKIKYWDVRKIDAFLQAVTQ